MHGRIQRLGGIAPASLADKRDTPSSLNIDFGQYVLVSDGLDACRAHGLSRLRSGWFGHVRAISTGRHSCDAMENLSS